MNIILHKIAFEINLFKNIYHIPPTYVIMSKATYNMLCVEYTNIKKVYDLEIIICDNYKYGEINLGVGV